MRLWTRLSLMWVSCLICLSQAGELAASSFFISLTSSGDADELTRSDLTGLVRRRFSQSLYLGGTHLLSEEQNTLEFFIRGRIDTDFARPLDESAEDPLVQEALQFALQLAYLRYTSSEVLSFRAGRLFLFGPLPALDLDGLSLQIDDLSGFSAQLGLGREVRQDQSVVDGGAFDAIGSRWSYFDDPTEETSWLVQGDVGWSNDWLSARGGHRVSWRHGDRVSQLTGLVARFTLDGWIASLNGIYNHPMESPDQLDALLEAPIKALSTKLRLGWSYYRPWFDGDSIFNVFPITPWVGWQLGADIKTWSGAQLTVSARQRTFALGEAVPWLGGMDLSADEHSVGGEVDLYAQILPVLHGRVSLAADDGYGGASLSAETAASWQALPERLELGLRLRYFYFSEIDGSEPVEHMMAGRLRGAFRLSSFGELTAYLESVTNLDTTVILKAMAMVSFDLGPF